MNQKHSYLKDSYPKLYLELHKTKNGDIENIKTSYSRNVIWVCELGHEWTCSVERRIKENNICSYCAGYKIMPGFNDMFTLYPDTINEIWDFEKNDDIPEDLSKTKKFWAVCEKEHSRLASMNEVLRGRKCPYCSNKKILVGYNDLATTHPELAKRIHPSSNYDAQEITAGSNKIVKWKCSQDERHVFEANVYRLTGKDSRDCSICAGKVVIPGINDFESHYPELSELWDYDKNNAKPSEVAYGSSTKRYWLGKKCNHSFVKSPKMLAKSTGCPYCSKTNSKVLKNYNDLLYKFPEIAKEWSSKNTLQSDEVHHGTALKAYWECEKGHEWKTAVSNRTLLNSNCPKCAMQGTSLLEQELAEYVVSLNVDNVIMNTRGIISPYELDIYVPDKNIAIEFNGVYWHSEKYKDKHYHYNKWRDCKDKGIQLLTIWEDEYVKDPELIKKMIAHKLGVSHNKKMYARKAEIVNVSRTDAMKIYEQNHIQGHRDGFHIGLMNKDTHEIIAVSTWSRITTKKEIRLERFATSCIIPGGFSKLLKHAIKLFSDEGFEKIITFADHCVSDGALYENHHFIADKELPPDYFYVYGQERKHKFGFRLKRFKNDPNLIYDKNLTERELADLNNIERLYDCGKTRYVLNINMIS